MCVAFFKSVSIQTCKTVQERDANDKKKAIRPLRSTSRLIYNS